VYDVAAIFPYVQDPDSGAFTFARLGEVSWWPVAILTALAVAVAVILALINRRKKNAAD
jgi:putative exporter of polyketide antibiotics